MSKLKQNIYLDGVAEEILAFLTAISGTTFSNFSVERFVSRRLLSSAKMSSLMAFESLKK